MSAQARQESFDGSTYDPHRDGERLSRQLDRVKATMRDGAWHTLRELAERAGASEASVSARIRDLRKREHGAHTIERRYVERGLFEYRMKVEPKQAVFAFGG